MKLIEIQRHFFKLKEDKNVYFCVEAESRNMNVVAVNYIRANKDFTLPENWEEQTTKRISGSDLKKIQVEGGLGMAYNPASQIRKLDTQVPDSMGDDTHTALDKLKKAVGGDVTDFVCERLQWSRAEIEDRLFAEQVDSVALAIYNMEAREQAMIIGDQTGIGKGRMAACLIRYAHVMNQIPIFVTEKANLFSDIYRDLKAIGCADLKPFIINNDSKSVITELDDDDKIKVVYRPLPAEEKNKIFAEKGKGKIGTKGYYPLALHHVPQEYDYVLTTYSQFNSKKSDLKTDFLLDIVKGNTIILDEAHNAGGSSKATGWTKKDENGETTDIVGSNTFKVFSQAVQNAKNVCFLSATFAKRPDNFPIFALRTCISESELKNGELISSISKGGEALQEILSSELVACGQMLRRERTYDGIKVNYIYLNQKGEEEFQVPNLEREHRAISDQITELMRDIINFEQTYIAPMIDEKNEELAEGGESAEQSNKELGVNRVSYFSKVFNIVNQVLFSIKADAVAEHAIRRLREDKKVVIACASTFESLYSDMTDDNESARKQEGESIKTDYSEALLRGLQNTLKYTESDEKGKKTSHYIEFGALPMDAQMAYRDIEEKIKNTTTGITISPIDYIIRKIERAGYRVAEVTGRQKRVEFTNEQGTQGYITSRQKIKANIAFAQFQNNQQDVLIINTSGSTGASAHATTQGTNLKPEQVKPRVMIIAQCELNISTEVQKRGRINRTGQIPELLPSYDYIISAIPAEARLMMMLQKKLRSLDANTASNQKNSTTVIDTDDFINKYGDQVVINYMKDNVEFTEKIGDPCCLFRESKYDADATADAARKVSGKVAVLSADEQEAFYTTVMDNYKQKVNQLKSRGEFDLEVETMKLDAKFIREEALEPRTPGQSVFADAAYLGEYECNVLRKPYTKEMVQSLLTKALSKGSGKEMAEQLAEAYKHALDNEEERRIATKMEQKKTDIEAMRLSPKNQKAVENGKTTWLELQSLIDEKYDSAIEKIKNEIGKKYTRASIIKFFYAGRGVLIDRNTKGICLGAVQDAKAKNPFAPSCITIQFAVASSERSADFNLADDGYKELLEIKEATNLLDDYTDHDARTLENWTEYTQKASANREVRQIITGNILKGFKHGKDKSKLITFTMENGDLKKGLLLPKVDLTDNSNGGKIVAYKSYNILKCKDILHDAMNNNDYVEKHLSNGIRLFINKYYGGRFQFSIETTFDKAADKSFANNAEWLKYNYGRGFEHRYKKYSLAIWPDQGKEHEELDNVIKSLNNLGIKLELTATEAEQYFADELETPASAKGDWKPLHVDKHKIPASKPTSNANNDDLKRKRARALMLKIKMAKAKL